VVEEWDNCGGAATTPVAITVGSEANPANSQIFTRNRDGLAMPLLPPLYNICPLCVPSGPQDYLGDDARRFFTDAERNSARMEWWQHGLFRCALE